MKCKFTLPESFRALFTTVRPHSQVDAVVYLKTLLVPEATSVLVLSIVISQLNFNNNVFGLPPKFINCKKSSQM